MSKFYFIFGSLFACLGILTSVSGIVGIYTQYHRYTTFVPVKAIIDSTTIKTKTYTSNRRTTHSYQPIIRYRYKVNGIGYMSEQYTPIPYKTSDHSHALSIINQFKVGQTVTAYRNPQNPNEAFLVKKYYFMAYLFTLFGMPFFVIGLLFIFSGYKRKLPPKFVGAGWYRFFPMRSVSDKLKFASFIAIIWNLLGAGVLGHYFMSAPKPYFLTAYVMGSLYEILGLIPIGFVIYFWILKRRTSAPVLLAERETFKRGEKVKIRIEQKFYAELLVEELLLILVCIKHAKVKRASKTEYKITRTYENPISLLRDHPVRKVQPLTVDTEIEIPSNKPPTSPKGYKKYPRYEWLIEVVTKIAKSPDSKLAFPITVEAAKSSSISKAKSLQEN